MSIQWKRGILRLYAVLAVCWVFAFSAVGIADLLSNDVHNSRDIAAFICFIIVGPVVLGFVLVKALLWAFKGFRE